MKKLILSFILLLSVQLTYSQIEPEWVIRYASPNIWESAYAIAADNSGNIYIAAAGGTGGIIIKYSSNGVEQWMRESNQGAARAIAVDILGNVYVTGSSSGTVTPDYATIKYNSDGVQQWVGIYNGPGNQDDHPTAIGVDNEGNVFVTGQSRGNEIYGYATVKYSPEGNQLWVKRYEPLPGSNHPYALAVDKQGNVIVTGQSFSDLSGSVGSEYATIKYSPEGVQLWLKKYNGFSDGYDIATAVAVDTSGNVYVTGASQDSENSTGFATIKYSSSGAEQWIRIWYQPQFPVAIANSIAVDIDGNVFVTGTSLSSQTNRDYATVKYNSNGVLQWEKIYDKTSFDEAKSVRLDSFGNVYVTGNTGLGSGSDMTTIKYDSDGNQQWIHTYNGPGNGEDQVNGLAVDQLGNAYITGFSTGVGTGKDITTIKYPGASEVYEPALNEKWIAGETDTIKWIETGWLTINIKCITDFETPIEGEIILAEGYPVVDSEFEWEIPDTLLSYRSKIIIENANNPVEKMESDIFRIKPYVLTRLNADSTYYEYKKDRDQWGFANDSLSTWPASWYNQFNYQGTDPFTNNLQYSQTQGDSTFGKSRSHYHPDWVSWVNTFGVDACYFAAYNGMYKPTALAKWWAKSDSWGGSCFGIAVANALAFSHKEQFQNKYPNYPDFINPITVVSDTGVKRVVNELFTHQMGNPHLNIRTTIGLNKTPKETLIELMQMFKEDAVQIRTLSFLNNGAGGGGHAILAYGLEKGQANQSLFHILVYDNSYPDSTIRITIDTSANANNGSWTNPLWPGWGGNKWIYLRNPTVEYLVNPTLPARNFNQSPFILDQAELQVINKTEGEIRISDELGNTTGFYDNLIQLNIPGSVPLVVDNGSETPPYGYSLQSDNYSVVLDEFEEDTISTFFFTGNKSFMYERSGADQTQTDRLFFDGGVSAVNPDAQTKTVKILNLINETTQEKLFVARTLDLAQNDSLKIENPDSNKVKLISYGTAKNYDVELNYVTENGIGRFGDFDIPLTANTSHTFVPDWSDITNTDLMVLVDNGNNGTIDDTLYLQNQVTGIDNDQGSLLSPNSYNLAQNYPNPFNPSTSIQYAISNRQFVSLKVYDVLGNEIATLVNEEKDRGVYTVNFNASQLSSGIYLYRIQAGNFVETKKMILLR